ncbi:16S rRNA (guanine(527)-N(7))-methyltransferase RsmG [Alteromonadaceae bacterium BrNp21-10]|nr:16S rRNA (guanine(527)-N(7))-methyltransferase RsmG [Alteromonadaceae bacterium BrNp21-10]
MPLTVSDAQKVLLVNFVQLIDKWNKAFNLTSVRDPKDMLIKHILDSIVVSPHLHKQHYIDVGTGPGLPGIPLAILNPDKTFVLLDSLGKRVRFMKQAGYELGLKNIVPVQSRVEQYQPEIELDGVISRAFASLKDMLHWCQHLVDSQGTFLALKGQLPQSEISTLPDGFSVTEITALQVSGLEGERHLIKIIKN